MNDNWDSIIEDYKKARFALVCPEHCSGWHINYDNGFYYLWKAYHDATEAKTKKPLWYARILDLMGNQQRYKMSDYDRFKKFVEPAYEQYKIALNTDNPPTPKEWDFAEREYKSMLYEIEIKDSPYDEQMKIIEGYEQLDDFGFHDSKPVFFSHTDKSAELHLEFGDIIVVFGFEDIYDIHVDGDPLTNWINDFYCYRSYFNKDFIIFDVGYYIISCSRVFVKSVERK